jgi:hypothetical protein
MGLVRRRRLEDPPPLLPPLEPPLEYTKDAVDAELGRCRPLLFFFGQAPPLFCLPPELMGRPTGRPLLPLTDNP